MRASAGRWIVPGMPTDDARAAEPDLSFLAAPGAVADWRLVLLYDVAARAGLLDHLPATAADLAGRLDLDERVARAVLDALGVWEVVVLDADGRYASGPGLPEGEAGAVLRHHAGALRQWAGPLTQRLHGEDLAGDRRWAVTPADFHDALAGRARRSAPATVDAVLGHFPEARSVLDLGGLHGEYAMEFAQRGLQATMQDVATMVEVARARGRLDAAGVQVFVGDFFDALPDLVFDVVLVTGVAHTYGPDANVRLYERLRAVLPEGGGLVIGTRLGSVEDPVGRLFAVQMALGGRGGDTHTEEDYRAWLSAAGYRVVSVSGGQAGFQGLVVALKQADGATHGRS